MRLPRPRGPFSETLTELLVQPATTTCPDLAECAQTAVAGVDDVVADDDVQVSLLTMYELHYRGVAAVDERWEWHPDLLAARAVFESVMEAQLRASVRVPTVSASTARTVANTLFDLTGGSSGPDLSGYLARKASLEQFREFVVHRSIYQLTEADPHTWAIPRLSGRAKAALVEIQADEYGGGRADRIHSVLFANTMRELDLDPAYGAYVDLVPAVTLADVNAMHLFGLHRRLRGALVGHLAAFEMTSSIPCRKYGNGLRRLGYDGDATWFFDEHVEADSVHEQIAAHDLAGGLAESEPQVTADILLGAAVYLELGSRSSQHMLDAWTAGRSSLRAASPAVVDEAG
ncbi:MAG: iron-containing redox enzyme family protein [Actinomycetota bacterium]|nr:iron-containing redox enzyme family protein [Actinomycetota bacterium]